MKRSRINRIIKDMEELIKEQRFKLPPFAYWTPEEWLTKNSEYDEIKDNALGWDITDFGLNDFEKTGFSLFTIRNGNNKNKKYKKPYAEKVLMLYEGQTAEMHFHASKMEDIINRGGNKVFITVYNGTPDKKMLETPVEVNKDGRKYFVPAGSQVCLNEGESITIQQYMFHDFRVPKEGGAVLLGEVSMCNDDEKDNYFFNEEVGRFPDIEEDEPAYRLLCNEYPKW